MKTHNNANTPRPPYFQHNLVAHTKELVSECKHASHTLFPTHNLVAHTQKEKCTPTLGKTDGRAETEGAAVGCTDGTREG